MEPETTELLVLHEWEWDRAFVEGVSAAARQAGVRSAAVGPDGMADALAAARAGSLPAVLLDRASDVLPEAAQLADLAKAAGVRVVNDPDRARAAVDKARMHLALMSAGVHVPHTVVLPAGEPEPPGLSDLGRLGTPFVLKPAHGSGGEGVVLDATDRDAIDRARAERPDDAILVQERLAWTALDGQPAYFRVLYCLGDVHACFWNPDTRRYLRVSDDQRATAWHAGLADIARAIAEVACMDLFSTEVAILADDRLVSVDYVNDMCDLRAADEHPDGVPAPVVDAIARRLVQAALEARS